MAVHGGAFASSTPDQLVAYQQASDNGTRYDVLDALQRYVAQLDGRVSTKRTAYRQVRSFFMHNRAELPRDPSFTIRGATPKVRGRLTPEDVQRMVLSCNPCYQAAFLCMFQGGMGQEEFLWWNAHGYAQLIKDLRGDPSVIKVDLPGRKRRKHVDGYYTFIGGDAIQAIRAWLPHRPEEATEIFTDTHDSPLTHHGLRTYWIRHLRKLGLAPPVQTGDRGHRTGMNLHELRDVFRSQWEQSSAKTTVAEFCMGHRIDPHEYNKSYRDVDFYRREYRKALPYLQIMSPGVPFGRVERSEVERLQDEVQGLKDQLQTVASSRRESDQVMDQLFQDPQFMAMLRQKLQEMNA
jgi:integrase